MTTKDIRHYRFLDRAIRISEKNLDTLREESTISDRVRGSSDTFPYTEKSISVTAPVHSRRIQAAEAQLERLYSLKREILFLSDIIVDPTDAMIFRSTMQGETQTAIGAKIGRHASFVSRRLQKIIDDYSD